MSKKRIIKKLLIKNNILYVFKKEAALYKKHRPLWVATIIIVLIPCFYAITYLGAFKDTNVQLNKLPVGVVNLDRGTVFHGKTYNLGDTVEKKLLKEKPFDILTINSRKNGEAYVRAGKVYFSMIIPPDFSKLALSGNKKAPLELITSQGTNSIAYIMGNEFIVKTAGTINKNLEKARWTAVTSELGDHPVLDWLIGYNPDEMKPSALADSIKIVNTKLSMNLSVGLGMAPYFMALSLWVGALCTAYLFKLIVFPKSVRHVNNIAKILGKGMIPSIMVIIGALLMGMSVVYFFNIFPVKALGYYIVLAVSAFTFLSIILTLVILIGDAGKLLAVILLVIQIASAGGVYPIELSPFIYRFISPFIPMTQTVNGLKAAMFGSFNGDYLNYVLYMTPWIFISLLLSFLSRKKFKYVKDKNYSPALLLSVEKE
ncbi:MAG: ABC transporter permease [bacterium]|nr:ABC transporter permease [bacterium]